MVKMKKIRRKFTERQTSILNYGIFHYFYGLYYNNLFAPELHKGRCLSLFIHFMPGHLFSQHPLKNSEK